MHRATAVASHFALCLQLRVQQLFKIQSKTLPLPARPLVSIDNGKPVYYLKRVHAVPPPPRRPQANIGRDFETKMIQIGDQTIRLQVTPLPPQLSTT